AVGVAASEGLGTPAKVGIGVGVAVAAGAVLAYALSGNDPEPPKKPQARHSAPPAAQPPAKKPEPKPKPPEPKPPAPGKKPEPKPEPKSGPKPPEKEQPPKPGPEPRREPPAPEPPPGKPKPPPEKPAPEPPPPPPAPAPREHQLNELKWDVLDPDAKRKGPTVRAVRSSWMWQRQGMSIGGRRYGHGVTVHAPSSVTIDLNKACTTYEALAGVDDMTMGRRTVRFSVYGDGVRLWRSPFLHRGQPAVPVRVPLAGVTSIRLVVEPRHHEDRIALANWARSQIACR
ncbi:NPCBM/NEW2 domain-containing protein, partial [Streptomyces iconiensis]